jgi:hypothetical protein
MSVRLFVLVAREARVAVVLRRGPTKQVLLVRWDLTDDSFEAGQWLRGRIYERRCDLSPSGDRLVYFAATYRPRSLLTWTAVSRPPYFTALALWPKGDAWGGGGLFESEDRILLNHPESARTLLEGTELPEGIDVAAPPYAGSGEDNPIWSERMERDGWTLDVEGQWGKYSSTDRLAWTAEIPETWSRPHPRAPLRLRMCTLGVGERQGSWYVVQYDVISPAGTVHFDLGRVDWADWDHNGDLLFAADGCLRRIACRADGVFDAAAPPRTLIDLSSQAFKRRKAVAEAKQWNGDRPRGVRL